MKMNKQLFFLLLAAGAAPLGCNMAPKYTRPAPPIPSVWPAGEAYQQAVSLTNAPVASGLKWQQCFKDEKLQHLIDLALTNNRDLKLALLNVQQARAVYGIQRAELFPAISGVAQGSRARVPHDLSNTGKSQIQSQYGVSLGAASWEVDFFGRIRSLKANALQQYLATEQAQHNAQIMLVSSVAGAYMALAADRDNLRLATTTLQAQQSTRDLIDRRYHLGLVSDLDLRRAQTQVESARGDQARFTQLVAQDKNALELLLGAPVPSQWLPTDLASVVPLEEVSAGLSSEVLLQRPDVLQAEDQLRAANANMGAARATFFPRVSLTAAVGTASSDLTGLFKAGSGAWSYAPQVVLPVFDARTWSAYKVAKVQREMAVTQYERAIQNAFREVADALAVRGTVDEQLDAQEALVKSVEETYRLSSFRYEKGIDGYLSVLDAQRSLYGAQQGLVSLRLAKLSSRVRLYAVLGGGWQSQPATTSTTVAIMNSQQSRQK